MRRRFVLELRNNGPGMRQNHRQDAQELIKPPSHQARHGQERHLRVLDWLPT
jgi:arylsulfatase A-like enzyme